ncbi:hypothetical protein P5673_030003 [Acropora cervicornis]|uniref:Integrase catalytic domain-containing protein n=1 Tax=Acropora cervicornis TaxID=6130 RepID=A0AAD9UTL7_ACRCE|nr:hypothetical protein P5673_030003 [Acropora cervicornis]
MVITDEYSRFATVEVVHCTAAEQVIQVVDKVFCIYGYPDVVKTDNSPPFKSQVWKGNQVGQDPKAELDLSYATVLRAYRCTPHTTTRFTPYRLLFGHDPRTKMPDAESFTHPDDSNVHERDAEGKNIMKCYAGKRLHAEAKPIDVGNTVLVKQPQLNKLSTPFNPTPLVVTERKGTMVTALRGDGSKVTRNFYMSRSIRRR